MPPLLYAVSPFFNPKTLEESTVRHVVYSTHRIRLAIPTRFAAKTGSVTDNTRRVDHRGQRITVVRSSLTGIDLGDAFDTHSQTQPLYKGLINVACKLTGLSEYWEFLLLSGTDDWLVS